MVSMKMRKGEIKKMFGGERMLGRKEDVGKEKRCRQGNADARKEKQNVDSVIGAAH